MVLELAMTASGVVEEQLLSMAINSAGGPATFEIALAVRDLARSLAKKGETGNLRRSIKAERVGKMESRVYCDPDIADYAIYVEYGTRKARAQPFMRPAIDTIFHGNYGRSIMKNMIREDMDLGIAGMTMKETFGSLAQARSGESWALRESRFLDSGGLSGQFSDVFSGAKVRGAYL